MKHEEVHPFDEVFTHVADGTGAQTNYNVTALYKHITEAPREGVVLTTVGVDAEHAEYCIRRRGVEADRIAVLVQNPEYCKKPIVFVKFPDGTHLLADGTHRYVVFFMAQVPSVPAYIVPFEVAQPFIIEGAPVVDPVELMETWSALTLLRNYQGPSH